MRKRSKAGRLGALALVLTCVTTALLSGTLAKYTTTVSGQDSATVAKFSFKATDQKGTEFASKPATINIFGGAADNKIAPGDTGSFEVILDGSGSEVAINLVDSKVTITNDKNIPLTYKVDGDTTGSSNLEGLETKITTTELNKDSKTYKVVWEWPDGADDASFAAADATVSIQIDVTATQATKTPSS